MEQQQEERIVIPGGEYITLEQAARLAGYNSAGNLRTAATAGKLKSIRINDHARITTEEWLHEYLGGLDTKRGRPRGSRDTKPRRRPNQPSQEETL